MWRLYGIDKISSIIFFQNFFFPGDGDFGVDLGGGDAVVPHQFLNISDVCSVVEQLGGEAVAQIVGCGVGIDSGQLPVFVKDFFNSVDSQAVATVFGEDGIVFGLQFVPGADPQFHFLTDDGRGDK